MTAIQGPRPRRTHDVRPHLGLLWLLWAPSACGVTTVLARDPLEPGARRIGDLRYHPSPKDADRRSLDLFLPAGPGPHPVVIFVHGGFWKKGGRREDYGIYQRLGRRLANQGVIAAVISYRLVPQVRHPSQANDVARAVATVRDNIGAYGGDPKQLYLMGHSAGAHLSLLVGWAPAYLAAHGLRPQDLAGIIAISGPTDLNDLATTWAGERNVPLAFGDDRDRWKVASPLTWVREGLPPTFLVLADHDFPVLRRENENLRQVLLGPKRPHRYREAQSRDHATIITQLWEDGDPLGEEVLQWIKRRPSPAPPPPYGSAPAEPSASR
jgi:acetyl esterase/lipase